jgi:hypothetical protein
MALRKYFDAEGFYEIETPILTKSTPEGARDFLVPARVHPGEFYALPQSPQIFKQILMIAGMDKYFQIARCFRDEDLRADRQPEFTQVDIEMSFPRIQSIVDLIEPLYQRVFKLIGAEIPRPFPRLSYADALARYGSDKPDLRFGMEIADVTDELATLGLDTFPGLIAEGARARAIVLPAAGGVSGTRLRKINEELWLGRIVPDARASKRNLFTLKATDEAVANLAKKGASEEVARRLLREAGAQKDDTVLVGVDREEPLAMALGMLRPALGRGAEADRREGVAVPVGDGLPALRMGRRREAIRKPAPSVHRADGRRRRAARQRSRHGAREGVRHRAERPGSRRRQPANPRLRHASQDLQAAGALRRGRQAPLRLLPGGAAIRHAAARRDRARARPAGDAAGRRAVAARRDRVPEDGERQRPDERRALRRA